jgi:hypothetical protein
MSFSKPEESIGSSHEDSSPLMSRLNRDDGEDQATAVYEYGRSRVQLGKRTRASTVLAQVWAFRGILEIGLLVAILLVLALQVQDRRTTLQASGDLTGFAPRCE